jgi:vanillate O-demethylase monooxygenase subunit
MNPTSRLADHTTPFIRNEWYVAADTAELGRNPMDRTVLGWSVLMYRKLDGSPVAMRNRCPHRSFPLSKGRLDGDNIICGYHGLTFGPNGSCVRVPSQQLIPPAINTPSLPLVERPPFVWIWMGDPSLADPAAIPNHHWLGDPEFASFSGYIHCKANYIRLHENVLDLTHFPYVHGEDLGGDDYIRAPFKVKIEGDSVAIIRRLEAQPVNAVYGSIIGNLGHRVHRTSESWFKSPAFHVAHAGIEDLDGGIDGRVQFHFKIIHCFTPETAHTSHYFFANARDVRIADQALTRLACEKTRATFLEDEQALELVERLWIDEGNSAYQEKSIKGDHAGVEMRRIIARRAAEEAL